MTGLALPEYIASCIEDSGMPYAVGGALALSTWSIPSERTNVHISIYSAGYALEGVFEVLERAGLMFGRDEATMRAQRSGTFSAGLACTAVDVFTSDGFQPGELLERRQRRSLPSGTMISVYSPEDLCMVKLFVAQTEDLVDLERMFATWQELDLDYIRAWLGKPANSRARLNLLADLVRRHGR